MKRHGAGALLVALAWASLIAYLLFSRGLYPGPT
jgi:hypothetical protein